jgi:hypothetical protein
VSGFLSYMGLEVISLTLLSHSSKRSIRNVNQNTNNKTVANHHSQVLCTTKWNNAKT